MRSLFLVLTSITELITAKKSKGEILVFPRGKIPRALLAQSTVSHNSDDPESGKYAGGGNVQKKVTGTDRADAGIIQRQTAIFSWKDVVYDIKIKKEQRRILDHVDGWVKPGTLTALMVHLFNRGTCLVVANHYIGCIWCR